MSQALKSTTTTTQLLTDMDEFPKLATETGVGPQLVPVVCMEPAGGPPQVGQPQFEACVLYDTTCADHNLRTPNTTEENKKAKICNEDTNCKKCGGIFNATAL